MSHSLAVDICRWQRRRGIESRGATRGSRCLSRRRVCRAGANMMTKKSQSPVCLQAFGCSIADEMQWTGSSVDLVKWWPVGNRDIKAQATKPGGTLRKSSEGTYVSMRVMSDRPAIALQLSPSSPKTKTKKTTKRKTKKKPKTIKQSKKKTKAGRETRRKETSRKKSKWKT